MERAAELGAAREHHQGEISKLEGEKLRHEAIFNVKLKLAETALADSETQVSEGSGGYIPYVVLFRT